MKNLNIKGYFWLPGSEHEKVAGELVFNQHGEGKLSLIGGLWNEFDLEASGLEIPKHSRIIGRVKLKYFTLDGCRLTGQSHTLGSDWLEQVFLVSDVLEGVAYDLDEKPTFDNAKIKIADLEYWSRISRIKESMHLDEDKKFKHFEITVGNSQTNTYSIPDASIRIIESATMSGDGVTERSVVRREIVELSYATPQNVGNILSVAESLRDLVSIATQRRSRLDSVILTSPDLQQDLGGKPYFHPVNLYRRQLIDPDDRNGTQAKLDLLFSLDDLGGLAAIDPWLKAAEKHIYARTSIMSTKYSPPRYIEQTTVTRLAALEDFLRIFCPSKADWNYAKKLKALVELAGSPFATLVPDPDTWIASAVAVRNTVAHAWSHKFDRHADSIYFHSEVAYWLFTLCLLREADAPAAVFEKLVKSQSYLHLQRELTSVAWG